MTTLTRMIAAFLLAAAPAALAHQMETENLTVVHPSIAVPPEGATEAKGFMSIENHGDDPDRLTGIEAPMAQTAILAGADGAPLAAIDIPAGSTVDLHPGGMHVLLQGLSGSLAEGDMVPATLIFEHAGKVEIGFSVDPADAEGHGAAAPTDQSQNSDDATEIESAMKASFERPEATLTVAPITVQGNVAVAGWTQGDKGGRAFLRNDGAGWSVQLFSGESLVLPASYISMGLGAGAAKRLADAVNTAEADTAPDLIARLNSFDGTVYLASGQ